MLSFHLSGLPLHPIPPPSCPSGMSCHTGSGSPLSGLLLAFTIIAATVIFVFLVFFISYKQGQRRDRAAASATFEQEQARLDDAPASSEKNEHNEP